MMVLTVTDGRGSTSYTYDAQNRLTEMVTPNGQTIAYSYDAAGNRLSLTTPAGTTTYTYDAKQQLSELTEPTGGTFSYQYDPVGQGTQLTYPNGVTVDYEYDTVGHLTGIHQEHAGQLLASYDYTLDPTGNRLSVVEGDGSLREWTYDDAYRLTSERQLSPLGTPQSQSTFTYDATGNRLTATTDGQTTSYTYNDLDQLLTAGNVQYSYDGRGNLTQVTDGSDVTDYHYNAAEQLTSVTLPDGTQISYSYDSSGQRVSQSVGTQVTNYLWDETSPYGDVLLETDSDGNALVSYVLGGTSLRSQLLSQERNGTVSYYLHDGQRSVRTLTDNTGAISDQYSYSAFGELEEQSGTTTNAYLYTGQQYDELTRGIHLKRDTGRLCEQSFGA